MDNADRLHTLATKMIGIVESLQLNGNGWNGYTFANSIPKILKSLDFKSYVNFNSHFINLCHCVHEDISILTIKKENFRTTWENYLQDIQGIFNPENFENKAAIVYRKHFSDHNLNALLAISDRLQTDGLQDSTKDDLKTAFDAMEDAIKAISDIPEMDYKISILLSHYLFQMRSVFNHYEIFGEGNFWKVYKETFATFIQVHSKISASEDADDIKRKIHKVLGCLTSKSVAGVSLIANAATIADFLLT